MKMAHVTPVYKTGSRSVKDNFHPVNIFERCINIMGLQKITAFSIAYLR